MIVESLINTSKAQSPSFRGESTPKFHSPHLGRVVTNSTTQSSHSLIYGSRQCQHTVSSPPHLSPPHLGSRDVFRVDSGSNCIMYIHITMYVTTHSHCPLFDIDISRRQDFIYPWTDCQPPTVYKHQNDFS